MADGDSEEIADMHEQDAEIRQKQKRKAKQLIKHGKVDVVDLRKARREGTLGDLLEGKEEEAMELERAADAAAASETAGTKSSDADPGAETSGEEKSASG